MIGTGFLTRDRGSVSDGRRTPPPYWNLAHHSAMRCSVFGSRGRSRCLAHSEMVFIGVRFPALKSFAESPLRVSPCRRRRRDARRTRTWTRLLVEGRQRLSNSTEITTAPVKHLSSEVPLRGRSVASAAPVETVEPDTAFERVVRLGLASDAWMTTSGIRRSFRSTGGRAPESF